jgi:uncharacterized protein with HEPN domain
MSPREWKHRIKDILQAIHKAGRYVEGMDLEGFRQDPKTVDAVLLNLIVLGEAATRVPARVRQENPRVPWRLMADMRNFSVHEYWGVDLATVWQTLQHDLPPLVPLLRAILEGRGHD